MKLTSTNVIHSLLSYQELCSTQALGWLPPSDPLEIRHPRLQFSLSHWGGLVHCPTALGTGVSVSGLRCPVLDSTLGCARVSCSSSRLSQLLQSQLLVAFLQLSVNWRVSSGNANARWNHSSASTGYWSREENTTSCNGNQTQPGWVYYTD